MYPVTVANGPKKNEKCDQKTSPRTVTSKKNHPSTAEQKLAKKHTPHLVLPIPDELEGLLKRLGVALPWATKISGSTSPKTLHNTGFHESFHYKKIPKLCISHYIYFPHFFGITIAFLCQRDQFPPTIGFRGMAQIGRALRARRSHCGALWLSNSRAEPKWPKWETRKLDQNRLQLPHLW